MTNKRIVFITIESIKVLSFLAIGIYMTFSFDQFFHAQEWKRYLLVSLSFGYCLFKIWFMYKNLKHKDQNEEA
jgi:flagellar basal body-associated protein FliL